MRLSRILKSFSLGLAGVFAILCVIVLPAGAGPLVDAGGVATTPSVYKVTITKIEFFNGTWKTFFSGTCTIDIASVAAGGSAGGCGAGNTLAPDTYTQMRLTINRTFGLKGSVTDAGAGAQPCRTSTGAASTTLTTGGGVTFSGLNSGAIDGAAATEQTLGIPTDDTNGSIATTINAIPGMAIDSSSLTMTLSLTFTVPEGEATAPIGFGMNFQVENKLEFLTTVGACTVANMPPIITITTPSGTSTFEPSL